MADANVTMEALVLYDNWPGTAVAPPFPVTDMTSASVGYNTVHPMWPVGTKWELYCYGDQVSVGVSYRQGYSTFIYLKGSGHMSGGAPDAARTNGVCPAGTITAGATDMALHTAQVDTGQTTHEYSGLKAICIGAVTNAYYAWYWCAGVYPVEYIASGAVADVFVTDDTATAAGVEIDGVILSTTIPGFRLHPTNAQTPGQGITLLGDGA